MGAILKRAPSGSMVKHEQFLFSHLSNQESCWPVMMTKDAPHNLRRGVSGLYPLMRSFHSLLELQVSILMVGG